MINKINSELQSQPLKERTVVLKVYINQTFSFQHKVAYVNMKKELDKIRHNHSLHEYDYEIYAHIQAGF